MTMVSLISPNRQNPVPDRTKNPISIHPRTANCEYCHTCNETVFHNDDRIDGKTGKSLPLAEDGQTSDLVIQIEDMTLGDDDYELGYEPCAINYCPMCGRKLREDV